MAADECPEPRTDVPANVLLAGPDSPDLAAAAAALGGPDRAVVRAGSGDEALRRLAGGDFAVAVLDLRAPGLDARQALGCLAEQEQARHTPVIILAPADAAGSFPADAAYELGAADYLVQPVGPAVLRAKVDAFVRLDRRAAALRADERRHAESALRASEDRFRLIVENAADYAILATDLGGCVHTWSRGAENLFGYAAAEAVGRGLGFIFPPEALADGAPGREMDRAVHDGRADDDCWLVRKDGSRFWASGRLFPLRNGTVKGFLKVVRDRTAERDAEEARQAESRRKDEFLATLAHELRNPLAPIRTGLQVLHLAPDEAARKRVCEMMDRQVRHLARMVDDLMDVSRVSRGKVRLKRERIDLRDVVGHAAEVGRPLVEGAGHSLSVWLPAEPVHLDADPTRLTQVFSNLLANAAKYTDAGGAVEVAAERDGPQAVVRVRDTGIGIPAEMLPRVFDLFAQVSESVDRTQGGLGIGLTLVKRLVELHGGSVEAHSEGPGKGSEFVVRLPTTA